MKSGAINESMADIFGAFAETYNHDNPGAPFEFDALLGEDMPNSAMGWQPCTPSWRYPYSTFRDMAHPERCNQPDRFIAYRFDLRNVDNGGVHTNSGIANVAAYLIIKGGQHYGYDIDHPMGPEKAAGFYNLLIQRLPSDASFQDLHDYAVGTARELVTWNGYGYTKEMACDVQNAFASIDIGSGDGNCDYVDDYLALDSDYDKVPDVYDNCETTANPHQEDADHDGMGDACDPDSDNDRVPDNVDGIGKPGDQPCPGWNNGACDDNCRLKPNPAQQDTVHPNNGKGDACDDIDWDQVPDHDWVKGIIDNCPSNSNPYQEDNDQDGIGNACDNNSDQDSIFDNADGIGNPGDNPCRSGNTVDCDDNCRLIPNEDQADFDGDEIGDRCDNCRFVSNDQIDTDTDGLGDDCDKDDDDDSICDVDGPWPPGTPGTYWGCKRGDAGYDNCQFVKNPDQYDPDHDGIGYACEETIQDMSIGHFQSDALTGPVREILPEPELDPALLGDTDYLKEWPALQARGRA